MFTCSHFDYQARELGLWKVVCGVKSMPGIPQLGVHPMTVVISGCFALQNPHTMIDSIYCHMNIFYCVMWGACQISLLGVDCVYI